MRSLGRVPLIQYDWCPFKEGIFGHRDKQREDNGGWRVGGGDDHL